MFSFKIVFIQIKSSTLDGWYSPNLLGANVTEYKIRTVLLSYFLLSTNWTKMSTHVLLHHFFETLPLLGPKHSMHLSRNCTKILEGSDISFDSNT
jgi:hypothetical protein